MALRWKGVSSRVSPHCALGHRDPELEWGVGGDNDLVFLHLP